MSNPERVILITTNGLVYAVDKLHNAEVIYELDKPLQPKEGWRIKSE